LCTSELNESEHNCQFSAAADFIRNKALELKMISVVVRAVDQAGKFEARLDGRLLCVSMAPFLDACAGAGGPWARLGTKR
jgi:hypothetical protein